MASPSTTSPLTFSNAKHSRNSKLITAYAFENPSEGFEKKGLISVMMKDLLKVDRIEHGRVICTLTVTTTVTNGCGTLHGGAVAVAAKMAAFACARTVVSDRELLLGELSTSDLSAADTNVELEIDGCVVRSCRNMTTTFIEFRVKETKKLVYTARAIFFTAPVSNL
ncbi:hypothetical protein MKW94_024960 [Papaver nudicaule]|uniref:Thioesterase domain-containing protein n=1 Tax=Papaver nudicaule TaxID=74823 RepID=A0AA41RWQ3_PAPNU|nr:hypothetical protein [Papaver nudicaule]